MLPDDWTPHRRDDGELLGWIRPEGEDWIAIDVLGRTAAHCLIERLQGWNGPTRRIELPGKLQRRGSS